MHLGGLLPAKTAEAPLDAIAQPLAGCVAASDVGAVGEADSGG